MKKTIFILTLLGFSLMAGEKKEARKLTLPDYYPSFMTNLKITEEENSSGVIFEKDTTDLFAKRSEAMNSLKVKEASLERLKEKQKHTLIYAFQKKSMSNAAREKSGELAEIKKKEVASKMRNSLYSLTKMKELVGEDYLNDYRYWEKTVGDNPSREQRDELIEKLGDAIFSQTAIYSNLVLKGRLPQGKVANANMERNQLEDLRGFKDRFLLAENTKDYLVISEMVAGALDRKKRNETKGGAREYSEVKDDGSLKNPNLSNRDNELVGVVQSFALAYAIKTGAFKNITEENKGSWDLLMSAVLTQDVLNRFTKYWNKLHGIAMPQRNHTPDAGKNVSKLDLGGIGSSLERTCDDSSKN